MSKMKNYIILAISIFLISLDARSRPTIHGKFTARKES